MRIINGQDEFHIDEGCAVTIGKFDGVHTGHQKLIKDAVSRAKVSGIKSCVITFENIFKEKDNDEKKDAIGKLSTFDEKKDILEKLGVDIIVVFSLDEEFMKMNPYAFIDSVLMDKLNMQSVTIGPDFRFGHKRDGKAMTFVKAAMIYGYGVNVPDPVLEDGKPVSSTDIRDRLKEGDMPAVNKMLDRPYSVSGKTLKGNQIGRKLGFPTMNLYPEPEKLLPPYGVYKSEVLIGGKTYKALTNVGIRPTVNADSDKVSVESHLLNFRDFGGNDYDKDIVVSFLEKMRDEKKFSSQEELAAQIKADIESVSEK